HLRHGHLAISGLVKLYNDGMVTGLRIDPASSKDFQCTACIAAKQSTRPFPKEAESRSMAPGEVTFSDVWGPA
ncbi:hypothetical protein CALCODRAFT_409005, partial [Calocera cornea HHB12733]